MDITIYYTSAKCHAAIDNRTILAIADQHTLDNRQSMSSTRYLPNGVAHIAYLLMLSGI